MLRIIFSERRHGTTSLSNYLGQLPNTRSLFEAFNKNHLFFCKPQFNNPSFDFHDFLISSLQEAQIINVPYKYLKILWPHKEYFEPLLKTGLVEGIIFLTRNPKDSYASLKRALIEGDWAANPEKRKHNQKHHIVGYQQPKQLIAEADYYQQIQDWFDYGIQLAESYGIPTSLLNFDELVHPDFKVNKVVAALETAILEKNKHD